MSVAGGLLGSACRALCAQATTHVQWPAWTATCVVNIVGAAIAGAAVGRWLLPETGDPVASVDRPLRHREHLVITGFLGGFTTVSGFAWHVVEQCSNASGSATVALLLALNGAVGIGAAAAGMALGRRR
jgi:fluoride ion exporter CrcB/FEX